MAKDYDPGAFLAVAIGFCEILFQPVKGSQNFCFGSFKCSFAGPGNNMQRLVVEGILHGITESGSLVRNIVESIHRSDKQVIQSMFIAGGLFTGSSSVKSYKHSHGYRRLP